VLVRRAARLAERLDAMAEHGFELSQRSIRAIGAAEARRARWGNAALWVIAAVLAVIAARLL
jgi:ubiquinone biosynthesis protein